jgi:hypothetical protein
MSIEEFWGSRLDDWVVFISGAIPLVDGVRICA